MYDGVFFLHLLCDIATKTYMRSFIHFYFLYRLLRGSCSQSQLTLDYPISRQEEHSHNYTYGRI